MLWLQRTIGNRAVQRMAEARSSSAADAGAVPAPVQRIAERGGGRPLPPGVGALMGGLFRHRFDDVRVHDDALAGEAARSVGAVAYTAGRDVVFAPGEYRPDTPAGLHLLAHELTHVVQQDGATGPIAARSAAIGPVDDPLEREADRIADQVARGEAVSPTRGGAGLQRRLQRAVSKVCNPPSQWFAMAAATNPTLVPSAIAAAAAFGAIAETFISASVISTNGITSGNVYLDNPLAGPIDPAYVAFIIGKNPGLSLLDQLAIAASMVVRPDVLMHQPPITEFEEVKPNSTAGRSAGRAKVRALDTFYAKFSLPYSAGSTYTPPAPFVIVSGTVAGVPITITFEISRDRNGLLVYDICVETDWLQVATLAIVIAVLIILAILTKGAIGKQPMPSPVPALTGGLAGTTTAVASAPDRGASPEGSQADVN